MATLLEINIKILNVKARMEDLSSAARELSKELDASLLKQQEAILGGEQTEEIETQIMSLQLKLSGTHRAQAQLAEELSGLEADRRAELRSLGRSEADLHKSELLAILADIYLLIVDASGRVPAAAAKIRPFQAALRADSPKRVNEVSVLDMKVVNIRQRISDLLGQFPVELFSDGTLPRPDQVKRTLKHSRTAASPAN